MSLIALDEARDLLLSDLPGLGSEQVSLDDALGRTLAEAVIASHTQPAEPRATMDGIAVPDLNPVVGTKWTMVGDAPAGGIPHPPLRGSECIRIATGAVVPEGAVRVIPQEVIEFSADQAILRGSPGSGHFIRSAGADFRIGDRLLDAGPEACARHAWPGGRSQLLFGRSGPRAARCDLHDGR